MTLTAKDMKIELDEKAIRAREAAIADLSDNEILERLKSRFDTFHKIVHCVKRGQVRALITAGPPGTGKTHGVSKILGEQDVFTKLAGRPPRFEIVKGTASAIGLYQKLFEFREQGNVVVFDDCDSVLEEADSLNLLKGALDSSEQRFISWNKDSRTLKLHGTPDRFEFKGSAIFITNIKFSMVKSKKLRNHLMAIESRCHYVDLEMDTTREKMIWVNHIANSGQLAKHGYEEEDKAAIMNFIAENKDNLSEISCRMTDKLADLRNAFPEEWRDVAKVTCCRRSRV